MIEEKIEKIEHMVSNMDEKTIHIFKGIVEPEPEMVVQRLITNIDNMSYDDLYNIILSHHKRIFKYDNYTDTEIREKLMAVFLHPNFMKVLFGVMPRLSLDYEEIICINKLSYDYITNKRDYVTLKMVLSISSNVNFVRLSRLEKYIKDPDVARTVVMIANSSFKMEKNIHRLNAYLISNIKFSVQQYIDMVLCLFDHFSEVFCYTMLEAWTQPLMEETKPVYDSFMNISMALLIILDKLSNEDIATVLRNYGYLILDTGVDTVRFSMQGLDQKGYKRIYQVIASLALTDPDIVIP